jgi:uracil-DNA glycosylase
MYQLNDYLEKDWRQRLEPLLNSPGFTFLSAFLEKEYRDQTVYPPFTQIFQAFNLLPFNKVKVVIIGQDPYHGEGEAHGLSFSVPDKVKIPPSLRNIFVEIVNNTGKKAPKNGDLTFLAEQGVFLLNSCLTVRANQAASHRGCGWESFTDGVVKMLNSEREHLVFMLWGNFAKSKSLLINKQKHLVLSAAHPSPLSAYQGFMGCRHFALANEYLISKGISPISWTRD